MFMTIVVIYVLTYLSTAVLMVGVIANGDMGKLQDVPLWKLQVYGIFARTYVLNNVVNPFIYGYFDMLFRKYIKNMLFCFLLP